MPDIPIPPVTDCQAKPCLAVLDLLWIYPACLDRRAVWRLGIADRTACNVVYVFAA